MHVVRSESFQPKLNFPEKSHLINSFLTIGNVDIISSLFVFPTNGKSLNGKSLMFDAVVNQVKTVLKGVLYQNKDNFQGLLVRIRELLQYIGPHENKFQSQNCPIPKFFKRICTINDPKRHKHGVGSIVKDKLNMLLGVITSQLEKSYIPKSFILLKEHIDMLTEAVVKCIDYLGATCEHVASYQESIGEPQYQQTITELPFDPEAKYTIRRGKNACKITQEHLRQKDFCDPICIMSVFQKSTTQVQFY